MTLQRPVPSRADYCVPDRLSSRGLFFNRILVLGIEDPSGTAIFAPVLGIAAAICAIFDEILAIAYSTSIGNCFLYHTSDYTHHLLLGHYLGLKSHPI